MRSRNGHLAAQNPAPEDTALNPNNPLRQVLLPDSIQERMKVLEQSLKQLTKDNPLHWWVFKALQLLRLHDEVLKENSRLAQIPEKEPASPKVYLVGVKVLPYRPSGKFSVLTLRFPGFAGKEWPTAAVFLFICHQVHHHHQALCREVLPRLTTPESTICLGQAIQMVLEIEQCLDDVPHGEDLHLQSAWGIPGMARWHEGELEECLYLVCDALYHSQEVICAQVLEKLSDPKEEAELAEVLAIAGECLWCLSGHDEGNFNPEPLRQLAIERMAKYMVHRARELAASSDNAGQKIAA